MSQAFKSLTQSLKLRSKIILRMSSNIGMEQKPPVESAIIRKISAELEPTHLQVINESYMHNVPKGSETHFKVLVVSPKFESMGSLINRHRTVNSILSDELQASVHALSIIAKTPKEFEKMSQEDIEPSPKCRGGFGK